MKDSNGKSVIEGDTITFNDITTTVVDIFEKDKEIGVFLDYLNELDYVTINEGDFEKIETE